MGSISHVAEEANYLHSHPDLWIPFVRHGWHEVKATGYLPDTPVWHYIEAKREHHPHRFDENHPCLAELFRYEELHRMLEELHRMLHEITLPIASCPMLPPIEMCPTQVPVTTCPTSPPTAGTTPEPSSIILLGIAIVVAMLRRIL